MWRLWTCSEMRVRRDTGEENQWGNGPVCSRPFVVLWARQPSAGHLISGQHHYNLRGVKIQERAHCKSCHNQCVLLDVRILVVFSQGTGRHVVPVILGRGMSVLVI